MSAYRQTERSGSENSFAPYGPIFKDTGTELGGWRRVRQKYMLDGHVSHNDVGIWDGQREGIPTVGVKIPLVMTREMWNTYKKMVDDLFDAFDKFDEL